MASPEWVQNIGPILGTALVAGAIYWRERREKKKAEPEQEPGTASVVAAYFFDKALVAALTAELGSVRRELIDLNEHMERAAQARHDEKIAREAAAAALAGRSYTPHA